MRCMKLAGVSAAFAGLIAVVAASVAPGPAVSDSGGPLVISVAAEQLKAKTFRPFGQIVEVPKGREPNFKNSVLRFWGGLAKARIHEQIEFGIFTVKRRVQELAELQRHKATPKFLISLNTDFCIAVAPSAPPKAGTAKPKADEVKVFLVKQGQAILLNKRVWHSLPFPVVDQGEFVVAFRDGTRKKDAVRRAFRGREIVKF